MSEFQPYPQGQIAIGNGVLQHASTAKLDATNNAKLVPAAMKAKVDAAKADIIAGTIKVHDYTADNTCPVQ